MKLSLIEQFVLIVQATTKQEAIQMAGNNSILLNIIKYLDDEYHLYEKKH